MQSETVDGTGNGSSSSISNSSTSSSTSTDKSKERMQALSLIMQCYDKRLEVINSAPISYHAKEYMNQTRQLEQDIIQRERKIQEYLAKANLTQEQVEDIRARKGILIKKGQSSTDFPYRDFLGTSYGEPLINWDKPALLNGTNTSL
jgi:hypothetical protein